MANGVAEFDPDAYLAEVEDFNPDAYLQEKPGLTEDLFHRVGGGLTTGLLGAGAGVSRWFEMVTKADKVIADKIGLPVAGEVVGAISKEFGGIADTLEEQKAKVQSYSEARRDRSRDPNFGSQLAEAAGNFAGQIGVTAMGKVPGIINNVGQMFEQEYGAAKERGADELTALQAGVYNMPAAFLDYFTESRIVQSLFPKGAKRTIGQVVKNIFTNAGLEGATEVIQDEYSHWLAGNALKYDESRAVQNRFDEAHLPETGKQIAKTFGIAALLGGTATGTFEAIQPAHIDEKALAKEDRLEALQKELDSIHETQKETNKVESTEPGTVIPPNIPEVTGNAPAATIPEVARVRAQIDPVYREHLDKLSTLQGPEREDYIQKFDLNPDEFQQPQMSLEGQVPPSATETAPITQPEAIKPISDETTLKKVDVLKRATDVIREGWDHAPQIEVVSDVSAIPDEAMTPAEKEAIRYKTAHGVFGKDGKVYLIGQSIPTIQRAKEIILHETKAHYGFKSLFGADTASYNKSMQSALDEFNARPKIADALARRGGFKDLGDLMKSYSHINAESKEGKYKLTEELLSRAAELYHDPVKTRPTWFNRIISRIKLALQPVMPGMKLNDQDIVNLLGTKSTELLDKAGQVVEQGVKPSEAKLSLTGESKPAPAVFLSEQKFEGIPELENFRFPLFNLTEDIPGHVKNSTISADTLLDLGYGPPEGYQGEFKRTDFPKFSLVAPAPIKDLKGRFDQIKDVAKEIKRFVVEAPKFTPFKKALLNWSANNQQSTWSIREQFNNIKKMVPDQARREAITNWIQSGGDKATLAQWESQTTDKKLQTAYKLAQELTPQEIGVANAIKTSYDSLRQKAEKYGIEINALDNYVNQIWNKGPLSGLTTSPKRLSDFFRFARKRYYGSFFEGEQAGLKPETKDIANLLGIYTNELNNAVNSRRLVQELSKAKASDGRPLLAPAGGVKIVEDNGKTTTLVFPKTKGEEIQDYKSLNQPALQGWRWKAEDEQGNPVLVKSDLLVHPEAYDHLKNVLGKSFAREWWDSPSDNPILQLGKKATKFLVDDVQSTVKQTMLGFLSPFHAVQEGTHAIGHRVNPFFDIPKIDLATDKGQMDAAQHGLMLSPDSLSRDLFMEGLGGTTKNLASKFAGKIPGIGPKIEAWSDGFQQWLFEDYIPGLKYKTYEHILERNKDRFKGDVASGKVTEAQVKNLSAQQANAAYGHLNYTEMGRNPSMQHFLQTFLLAPDFLEARGRFTAQALKPSKTGTEQLFAMGTLAASFYVAARILNKLFDDDYHWDDPFEVQAGNRVYSMRSVPEDIYRLFKDSRRFIYGRISPIFGKLIIEGTSGVNYRKEPIEFTETLKNMVAGTIPLTLQPFTRGLTEQSKQNPISPLEQILGASGLQVRRYSPISKMYELSKEWVDKNLPEKKKGTYPVSKYSQLRYALEDGDYEKAQAEIDDLVKNGETKYKIATGFRQSVTHPFTGSAANDEKFKNSLSEEDKKFYDAAIKRRQVIMDRFYKVYNQK